MNWEQEIESNLSQNQFDMNQILMAIEASKITIAQSETESSSISNSQIHKETPNNHQQFQLTQQTAVCKICYKYAINASNCANKKCSVLICGNCMQETIKKLEDRCPFCRLSPFESIISIHRNAINRMRLCCKFCKEEYVLEEEINHYKKKCKYFKLISCKYCLQKFQPEEIVKHTFVFHQNKIEQIIKGFYFNQNQNFDPDMVINKQKHFLNKIGKDRVALGSKGKFYCGGKLQGPKCLCCNGYCGPTNGENCVQCMRLDQIRFGLPKGYLVNAGGNICWKVGDDFVCGLLNKDNVKCQIGKLCKWCQNLKKTARRYKDLL